jgi:hypothetical protein
MKPEQTLTFLYRNYKGNVALRSILPGELVFKSTEFHPEPQWIIVGLDVQKGQERSFAVRDIISLLPNPQPPSALVRALDRALAFVREAAGNDMSLQTAEGWLEAQDIELSVLASLGLPDEDSYVKETSAMLQQIVSRAEPLRNVEAEMTVLRQAHWAWWVQGAPPVADFIFGPLSTQAEAEQARTEQGDTIWHAQQTPVRLSELLDINKMIDDWEDRTEDLANSEGLHGPLDVVSEVQILELQTRLQLTIDLWQLDHKIKPVGFGFTKSRLVEAEIEYA